MKKSHEQGPRPKRVSEAAPVQVFLSRGDRALLDRLTEQLDATKSEVLRRSLTALERQLLDPDQHPALRVIGLVADDDGLNDHEDAALAHDRLLAEAHDASLTTPGRQRRGKS